MNELNRLLNLEVCDDEVSLVGFSTQEIRNEILEKLNELSKAPLYDYAWKLGTHIQGVRTDVDQVILDTIFTVEPKLQTVYSQFLEGYLFDPSLKQVVQFANFCKTLIPGRLKSTAMVTLAFIFTSNRDLCENPEFMNIYRNI